MNIVFLILLFLAPGLIAQAINDFLELKKRKHDNKNVYEQLVGVVVNSSIVSTISLWICNFFNIINATNFDDLFNEISEYRAFCLIVMIIVAVTIVWTLILRAGIFRFIKWLRNKYYLSKFYVTTTDNEDCTVWEDIMLSQPHNDKEPLVIIKKVSDGTVVSGGFINEFSESDPLEIKFDESESVLELYAEEEKSDSKRYFGEILYSYYYTNGNIIITFYNSKLIYEHWDEIISYQAECRQS